MFFLFWIPGFLELFGKSARVGGACWLVRGVHPALWLAGCRGLASSDAYQLSKCTFQRSQSASRDCSELNIEGEKKHFWAELEWWLHNLAQISCLQLNIFLIWLVVGCESFSLISNLKSVNTAQTHVASISTSQTDRADIESWIRVNAKMYKFFNVEVMYISYLQQIGQQQKADTESLLNPVL